MKPWRRILRRRPTEKRSDTPARPAIEYPVIRDLVVASPDGFVYKEGVDYKRERECIIQIPDGRIPAGEVLHVSYGLA